MAPANLGVVFGPTLMRADGDTSRALISANYAGALVELLIEQHAWFFGDIEAST